MVCLWDPRFTLAFFILYMVMIDANLILVLITSESGWGCIHEGQLLSARLVDLSSIFVCWQAASFWRDQRPRSQDPLPRQQTSFIGNRLTAPQCFVYVSLIAKQRRGNVPLHSDNIFSDQDQSNGLAYTVIYLGKIKVFLQKISCKELQLGTTPQIALASLDLNLACKRAALYQCIVPQTLFWIFFMSFCWGQTKAGIGSSNRDFYTDHFCDESEVT